MLSYAYYYSLGSMNILVPVQEGDDPSASTWSLCWSLGNSVQSFLDQLVASTTTNHPRHPLSAVYGAEVVTRVVSPQGKGRYRTNTVTIVL